MTVGKTKSFYSYLAGSLPLPPPVLMARPLKIIFFDELPNLKGDDVDAACSAAVRHRVLVPRTTVHISKQ